MRSRVTTILAPTASGGLPPSGCRDVVVSNVRPIRRGPAGRTSATPTPNRWPTCSRRAHRLAHTGNAGSALGFGQGWWMWILLAIAGLLLIPVYARWLGPGRLAAFAVALQLGGALGNVADRLLFGGATDVLFLGRGPVWNLADIALLVGTLLATWTLQRNDVFRAVASFLVRRSASAGSRFPSAKPISCSPGAGGSTTRVTSG
jgi:lipoprotein signal peptidase